MLIFEGRRGRLMLLIRRELPRTRLVGSNHITESRALLSVAARLLTLPAQDLIASGGSSQCALVFGGVAERPNEADQLACDRGDYLPRWFPFSCQLTVAATKTQLCLPGE